MTHPDDSPEIQRFAQVAQRLDPHNRLRRAWPLQGGISAQVTALEIEGANGQLQTVVVRRHGGKDLQHNPGIAADEFRLLQHLYTQGLAVPRPYLVDSSGEIFTTPYLVIAFIDGQATFSPPDIGDFIRQFTAHLVRIHQVKISADLPTLPDQTTRFTHLLHTPPTPLNDSLHEGRIRTALQRRWPPAQINASVLLHGDYWPGNILWKDHQVIAIIDWEDAAIGDPLADLANGRLEILWAFDSDAMQDFTRQYQRLMPQIDLTNLPWWDLYAALRPIKVFTAWTDDEATRATMQQRHELFTNQALSRLSEIP